jgi:thiosulfate dehydrogenase (quinone) large subunit
MNATRKHPDHPDRWLAVLRVAVGLWFLKSVVTKLELTLLNGVLPLITPAERWAGFMPGRVAEFAGDNPVGWYGAFLERVVIPHGALFASLTAYGEAVVGLGLTLGLLTRAASVIGLFLSLNYLLATGWMTSGQMGFHFLLIACMCAFLGASAGRTWGLDGWLGSRSAARRVAQLPRTSAGADEAPATG